MKKIFILLFTLSSLVSFSQDKDYKIEQARKHIKSQYGHSVFVKDKPLTKFGFNPDISTAYETVWSTGGNEFYVTGNTIDSLVSSDNSDTQIVAIEGHTIDQDGVIRFVSFNDTLTGQTPKQMNTALYRMTRLRNTSNTDFAGVIYGYSGGTVTAGVPQVADSIHLSVPIGYNRSQKASTTISSFDYWIITQIELEVGVSSGNNRIVDAWLEVRQYGGVFERIHPLSASNNIAELKTFQIPIIIPPRADVRVVAISSGTGTQVKAVISGYLALINE